MMTVVAVLTASSIAFAALVACHENDRRANAIRLAAEQGLEGIELLRDLCREAPPFIGRAEICPD